MLDSKTGFFGHHCHSVTVSALCGSESVYPEGLTLPPHAHPRGHLCLVVCGEYVERLRGVTEHRGPLTLIFYPPDCPHSETHYKLGRHFMLDWDPQWAERVCDPSRLPTRPLATGGGPGVLLALKAYRALRTMDGDAPLTMEQLLVELLAEFAGLAAPRMQSEPRWMKSVINLLEEFHETCPSVLNIAESMGLHPSHLSRSFRQWTGLTLGEFRRLRQLERACRRLLSSNQCLSSIAADTGFSDQSHLTRLVRQATGFTPKTLRACVHDSA